MLVADGDGRELPMTILSPVREPDAAPPCVL